MLCPYWLRNCHMIPKCPSYGCCVQSFGMFLWKLWVCYKIVKLRLKFRCSGSARITCLSLNQTAPCFVLFSLRCFLSIYILHFLCFSCLHLISVIFFWGGGGWQYLMFCKMLLLETQVFCSSTVLPEDLNVWESFCIRQTEIVSVNHIVGFRYNLEWGFF